MKRKIFTVILSAMVCTSAAALPAEAMPAMKGYFDYDSYYKVDNADALNLGDYEEIYLNKNGNETVSFNKLPDQFTMLFPLDTDTESICNIISEIAPDTTLSAQTSVSEQKEVVTVKGVTGATQVKEIYEAAQAESEILKSQYFWDYNEKDVRNFKSLTTYECDTEEYAQLSEYAAENLPDWSIVQTEAIKNSDEGIYDIVPPEGVTVLERLEAANQIRRDTGFRPYYVILASGSGVSSVINVKSSVSGDANFDSSANIADAVAVLQYLANEEKYPLTPQGIFNADVDGSDGLTGADATVIQMIDAGVF
ncbi:MAG: dockerin type I repeat-containing protein [Ruminococcus sp.]|nr:dockerin type I repeat-containing protein [Ruminococcus sp.]